LKQVKPCKKHGVVERTNRGECKLCNAEWSKNYKTKNKEKYNKHQRDYYIDNIYCLKNVKTHLKQMANGRNINLSSNDMPLELIEIKRLQMQLHHAIKAAKG
jgi:hypothetical protein